MLQNYIRIAWRNLLKHKAISLINLIGLSFSISFCFLLFLYIRHEQSYDTFHRNGKRLFRMEMTHVWGNSPDQKSQIVWPAKVAEDLVKTFPQVKSVTRLKPEGAQLVRVRNEVFKEPNILYADANFFQTFSFPLLKGSSAGVLSSLNGVVLSASAAKQLFGNANPIGQTLTLINDSAHLLTVSGVAADAPANSSIQFDVVIPVTANPDYTENMQSGFNECNYFYVAELAGGVSVPAFEKQLLPWIRSYFNEYYSDFDVKDRESFHWHFRPLAEAHYNASGDWGHYTSSRNIYQLACLVLVILLIASLNYVLLTVSNAAARSQEVGVRKVMGAGKRGIILQFWVETQVIVVIAVVIGLSLALILLPFFNQIMGEELRFADLPGWETGLTAVVLSIGLGLLAGYYPALLLSRMRAVSVIKSFRTFKVNPRFSRILVVVQYTACIVLMMAAFVIDRQMRYVSNKDLGFDKEQVLLVENPSYDGDFTRRVRERLGAFAQTDPDIVGYAGMAGSLDGGGNDNGFKLNGDQYWLRQVSVDYNYFNFLGLKFVQGRPFSPDIRMDTSAKIRPSVINETLFKLLGKDAQLGVYNKTIRSTIIGVVKDYHFESLSKTIMPEQHVLLGGYQRYFMFKVRAGKTREVVERLGKEWRQITGSYPFDYTFLDEAVAAMYKPEMRWQSAIRNASLFAIFISCLGLFGLSAINAANRTKEIGIRKVLGASIRDIAVLLSRSFVGMVVVALLIATPVAWWLMNGWLEDFAYRIHISWWMFGLVGLCALVIALGTVSIQAIRAAVVNPVDSLRTE